MLAGNPIWKMLVIILLTIFPLIGCGSGTDSNTEDPRGCNYIPLGPYSFFPGRDVPSNSCIEVTFNDKIDYAEITISEAIGITHVSDDRAIWTPSKDMSLGYHTITVYATSGSEEYKTKTPESWPVIVVAPDKVPPQIVDAKCDPKNSTLYVNPDDYPGGLAIAFTEPMLDIEVVSANPGFEFTERLRYPDGDVVLYVDFVDYKMPYDTEFRITLSGTDFSRNELATTEYWFRTKKE